MRVFAAPAVDPPVAVLAPHLAALDLDDDDPAVREGDADVDLVVLVAGGDPLAAEQHVVRAELVAQHLPDLALADRGEGRLRREQRRAHWSNNPGSRVSSPGRTSSRVRRRGGRGPRRPSYADRSSSRSASCSTTRRSARRSTVVIRAAARHSASHTSARPSGSPSAAAPRRGEVPGPLALVAPGDQLQDQLAVEVADGRGHLRGHRSGCLGVDLDQRLQRRVRGLVGSGSASSGVSLPNARRPAHAGGEVLVDPVHASGTSGPASRGGDAARTAARARTGRPSRCRRAARTSGTAGPG